MHDLINLLQVIGGFAGAFATALAITHKSNKADYNDIIKNIKKSRDEFRDYYHAERERRIKVEEQLSDLKIKYDNLKSKFKKEKEHQSNDD